MNILLKMLLTLAVGRCRRYFRRFKVPNGFRIGELFDSALLGIFFGAAWMPAKIKFAVQMLAGAVGGLLRNISGISAGTFLCSTVAVLVLKLSFNFVFLPHWIKEIASLSAAVISEAL